MIAKRLNLMRKMTKSMLMWMFNTSALNRSRHRIKVNYRLKSSQYNNNSKQLTMTMMMTMKKKSQAHIILHSTPICLCQVKLKSCLSTSRDTNRRKLTLTQELNHLFLIIYQQWVKLMHFWKCQSLMAQRRILESQYWTNLLSIMKTKLC